MKKHLTPFRVVAGLLVLLVFTFGGIVAAGWLLPPPAIVVSEETTYITEPLRADGLVDYREAYRRMYFADLTRENNAIFDYAQIVNPEDAWQDDTRAEFKEVLGLTKTRSTPLVSLRDFAELHSDLFKQTLEIQGVAVTDVPDEELRWQFSEQLWDWEYNLERRPWRGDDFPLALHCIQANKESLQIVEHASRKPEWFMPSVAGEDLLTADLWLLSVLRETTRMLSKRAMLKIAEGEWQPAWDDLMTIDRIAMQSARHPVLIDWLTGLAHRRTVQSCVTMFAHETPLSREQLEELKRGFEALPEFPDYRNCLGDIERFYMLDMIQQRPDDPTLLNMMFGEDARTDAIDWNVIMRCYNEDFETWQNALRNPTPEQRDQACAQWQQHIEDRLEQFDTKSGRIQWYLSRGARSYKMAYALVLDGDGLYNIYPEVQARNDTLHQFTRLAITLAQYRAAHGEYPESLEALVPEFLAELPADPFAADGRFGYERCDDGGYRLYSSGLNGVDDGGSSPDYHEDYSEIGDDIVLRVPVQEVPDDEL